MKHRAEQLEMSFVRELAKYTLARCINCGKQFTIKRAQHYTVHDLSCGCKF